MILILFLASFIVFMKIIITSKLRKSKVLEKSKLRKSKVSENIKNMKIKKSNKKFFIKRFEYEDEKELDDYLNRLTFMIYGVHVSRLNFKDNNKYNLTSENVSLI